MTYFDFNNVVAWLSYIYYLSIDPLVWANLVATAN